MATNGDIKPGTRASFVRHMVRDSISKLLNRLSTDGIVDHLPGVGGFNTTEPDHLPPRPDESLSLYRLMRRYALLEAAYLVSTRV